MAGPSARDPINRFQVVNHSDEVVDAASGILAVTCDWWQRHPGTTYISPCRGAASPPSGVERESSLDPSSHSCWTPPQRVMRRRSSSSWRASRPLETCETPLGACSSGLIPHSRLRQDTWLLRGIHEGCAAAATATLMGAQDMDASRRDHGRIDSINNSQDYRPGSRRLMGPLPRRCRAIVLLLVSHHTSRITASHAAISSGSLACAVPLRPSSLSTTQRSSVHPSPLHMNPHAKSSIRGIRIFFWAAATGRTILSTSDVPLTLLQQPPHDTSSVGGAATVGSRHDLHTATTHAQAAYRHTIHRQPSRHETFANNSGALGWLTVDVRRHIESLPREAHHVTYPSARSVTAAWEEDGGVTEG